MIRKSKMVGTFLLSALPALAFGIAMPADAAFERINVQTCEIPRQHEVNVISDNAMHLVTGLPAFCPVPDNSAIPVGSIRSYALWGVSGITASSGRTARVRACNAFAETAGTECSAFTTLPHTFANFNVAIPAFWTQWWHSQFVEIDPTSTGNVRIGRILVKN